MQPRLEDKECPWCGWPVEKQLAVGSSSPYFRDDPPEWEVKPHSCLYYLKQRIVALEAALCNKKEE